MSESEHKPFLRRLVALALAGVAAFGLVSCGQENASPTISGAATVIDGDTIVIAGHHIRLEGIDAPETSQTCGRNPAGSWPCGKTAANALAKLIGNARVDCTKEGHDKYDRVLGICSANGLELNDMMVRSGLAWAFVKYSTAYAAVEAKAKAAGTGVWQGRADAPWDYRAGRWQTAEQTAPNGCAIKGNVTDKGHIYHMPWSPWYGKVRVETAKGERWFCSETEAQKAGWRAVY